MRAPLGSASVTVCAPAVTATVGSPNRGASAGERNSPERPLTAMVKELGRWVTFPVDKEYGKALTAADGTTLITGSLTATYTNLSTGKAITEKLNGPGKITRRPGSLTTAVKGRSGLFLSPADARRFALPTVAVTAGAQTVTLALPSGAVTSLTLHGHVLVDVCAALS